MRIAVDSTDPATVLVSIDGGTLDVDTAPGVLDALLDAANLGTGVILDVSATVPVGPAGVALLLAAHMALAGRGRVLRLRGISAGVAELLRLSGLDRTLEIEPPQP